MGIVIREANEKDVKSVSELFDAYRVFYKKNSDIVSATEFLTERMRKRESVIFIAEVDNVAKGFIQLYPLFSSTRMKRLWLLNDLFVNNKYRKMGLGEQLIDRAKELARSTDSCGLLLETSKSNTVANELYVKTDFALSTQENFYTWEC